MSSGYTAEMRNYSCLGLKVLGATLLVPAMLVQHGFAWGNEGHMMINRMAGETLPTDVPEFLRSPAGLNALAYYGPEPDRWRSSAEPELNAAQAPEHFIDLEYADMAGPLPRRRYDFIRALAAAQAAHPDVQLTPEKVGLQPYVTTEVYERLKSAMRDYRALLAARQDTKPTECEITFLAGWLGHYVADGAQPLHASMEYNGWVGANPHGYTTEHHIHSQFESDFVKANVKEPEILPLVRAAKPTVMGDVFDEYVKYLRASNALVEKTYQLEKAGGYQGGGTPDAKDFVESRMAAGAQELRDMIYTAWVKSGDPVPPYRP